jgi:hypothetical protein
LRDGPGEIYDRAGWATKGDAFALLARTEDSTWWQIAHRSGTVWVIDAMVDVHRQGRSIPVARDIPPTPTFTPTPLPAPLLVEPLDGDSFPYRATIRFKFTWYRMLEPRERVSVYLQAANGSDTFDWRASAEDILGGGGAIARVGDNEYLFEINSGMGNLPPGETTWKVAIFMDTAPGWQQISPWSQERRITQKPK